jgi:hypothetical protein
MGWRDIHVDVSEMLGMTFSRVVSDHDTVTFENDQVRYVLYHDQDCCESVYVEDIIGDLEDLTNLPLLISREDTNAEDPETFDNGESYTWTFYNFATYKGYVTIRFLGESNGYYSEEVYCRKEILNN